MARQPRKTKAATTAPPPSSSTPNPQTAPHIVTKIEEWQAAYGDEWSRIVTSPAFTNALWVLHNEKLKEMTTLTPEQIGDHGKERLAEFKGYLTHEEDLLTLHTKREFSLPYEEPEEYLPPEVVAKLEETKKQYREQMRRSRYA